MTYINFFGVEDPIYFMEISCLDVNVLVWSRHVKSLMHSMFKKWLIIWMHVFPICLFSISSPKHYPLDEIERYQLTEQMAWHITTRFDWNNDIANQCKRKILDFVEISMKVCERKGEHEAWLCCGTDREFMRNWHTMMKLWQWIVVIYARTTICECGFSKHNWVKSDHWSRLKLETLDAFMRVSLCGVPMKIMDWVDFLTLGNRPKTRGLCLWSWMMIKCIM